MIKVKNSSCEDSPHNPVRLREPKKLSKENGEKKVGA